MGSEYKYHFRGVGDILRLYWGSWDNGKENGNYYSGFRVQCLGFKVYKECLAGIDLVAFRELELSYRNMGTKMTEFPSCSNRI